ncbi:TPA: hypothetical protein HA265_07610 [Candidatus Woesearchaeota archaeon]|nr:hypothetical protein [Candidatus Woesearchaeota archaeon]
MEQEKTKEGAVSRAMGSFMRSFEDFWPLYIIGVMVGVYAVNHQVNRCHQASALEQRHQKEFNIATLLARKADLNADGFVSLDEVRAVLGSAGYTGPVSETMMFEVYDPELVRDFDGKPLYDYKGVERRGNTVYIPIDVARSLLDLEMRVEDISKR